MILVPGRSKALRMYGLVDLRLELDPDMPVGRSDLVRGPRGTARAHG